MVLLVNLAVLFLARQPTPDAQLIFSVLHAPNEPVQLYRVEKDGAVPLRGGSAGIRNLVSSDHRWLLSYSPSQIFRVRPDGGVVHEIPVPPDYWIYNAAWSPDGAWILMNAADTRAAMSIFRMRVDGSGWQQITDFNEVEGAPVWSADGESFIFRLMDNRHAAIFRANADGSNPQQLTYYEGSKAPYQFSPDGQQIAFITTYLSTTTMTRMKADGTDRQVLLTLPMEYQHGLAWSSDGDWIYSGNEQTLYRVKADGSAMQNLAQLPEGVLFLNPQWSPDKQWLAFESGCMTCFSDIFVVRADGTDLQNLTENAGFFGSWSPNWVTPATLPLRFWVLGLASLLFAGLGFLPSSIFHFEL